MLLSLGPVHTTRAVATGGNFPEFQERGAHCSRLLKRRATTKSGKLVPSLRLPPQHARFACRGPRLPPQHARFACRGPRLPPQHARFACRGPRLPPQHARFACRGPRVAVKIGSCFVEILGCGMATARRGEIPPRLNRFSLATPSALVVLTGPRVLAPLQTAS